MTTRTPLVAVVAVVVVVALALAHGASACGGLFCSRGAPVEQAGEQIFFDFAADGTTTAHIQIKGSGSSDRFSWVLPMPYQPSVAVSSERLFSALQRETTPQFSLRAVDGDDNCKFPEPCDPFRFMCAEFDAAGPTAGGGGGDGLTVVDSGVAGAFEYEILTADGSPGLAFAWLQAAGYDLPVSARSRVTFYATSEPRHYFVALKLKKGASIADLQPVALTYTPDPERPLRNADGDELSGAFSCVPLQLTAVAATEAMPIWTYVLGPGRARPANLLHAQVDLQAYDWLRCAIDTPFASRNGCGGFFGGPALPSFSSFVPGRGFANECTQHYTSLATNASMSVSPASMAFVTEYARRDFYDGPSGDDEAPPLSLSSGLRKAVTPSVWVSGSDAQPLLYSSEHIAALFGDADASAIESPVDMLRALAMLQGSLIGLELTLVQAIVREHLPRPPLTKAPESWDPVSSPRAVYNEETDVAASAGAEPSRMPYDHVCTLDARFYATGAPCCGGFPAACLDMFPPPNVVAAGWESVRSAMMAALSERVFEPARAAQRAFDVAAERDAGEQMTLTRLFTAASPRDMKRDVYFRLQRNAPQLRSTWSATIAPLCNWAERDDGTLQRVVDGYVLRHPHGCEADDALPDNGGACPFVPHDRASQLVDVLGETFVSRTILYDEPLPLVERKSISTCQSFSDPTRCDDIAVGRRRRDAEQSDGEATGDYCYAGGTTIPLPNERARRSIDSPAVVARVDADAKPAAPLHWLAPRTSNERKIVRDLADAIVALDAKAPPQTLPKLPRHKLRVFVRNAATREPIVDALVECTTLIDDETLEDAPRSYSLRTRAPKGVAVKGIHVARRVRCDITAGDDFVGTRQRFDLNLEREKTKVVVDLEPRA